MDNLQFYSAPGRKRLLPLNKSSTLALSIPSKKLLEKLKKKVTIKIKEENDNNKTTKIKLKKIKMTQVMPTLPLFDSIIDKLPKVHNKKLYIFGDIISFIKRYKCHHYSVIVRKLIELMKKYEELKKTMTILKKKRISYCKFNNIMMDCTNIVKREIGFKKRCQMIKLVKLIPKIMKRLLLKKLKQRELYYNKAILHIQSFIKGYTIRKWYREINNSKHIIKRKYKAFIHMKKYNKAVIIQKNYKRRLVKKKYSTQLYEIQNCLKHYLKKKEYERKMNIVHKQRDAVKIIEKFWNGILEKRYEKQLEEQIAKMSPECQELYRKFLLLRKDTRNLKRDLIEYSQNEHKKKFKPSNGNN